MFKKIHKYQELKNLFNTLNPGDWVVFDVDDVLTVSSHPAFQTANIQSHHHTFFSSISDLSKDERYKFFNLALLHHKSILLDPEVLNLLQLLKEKQVHTVALTAVMNGSVGNFENMAHWRYEELKSLGIEFIHPHLEDEILFDSLPAYQGFHPSYYKGILFQNSYLCSKGDVLKEYFDHHIDHPKQLVMIDDRDYNLESISSMLSTHYPKIKYHGIWFKAADTYSCEHVDKKTAETVWNEFKKISTGKIK